jgi:hypothetical protein
MAIKKNYNLDAMTGGDTDDLDLCDKYNIDPALAYTPMINDAMFKVMNQESVAAMIADGYTVGQAKEISDQQTDSARGHADFILKHQKQ